ncbi:MAG: DUF2339 domain-containing protein [Candidatus Sumerlaeota bacterium]
MSLSPEQIRTQLASQAMRLRALEVAVGKLDPSFRSGVIVPALAVALAPVAAPAPPIEPVALAPEPSPARVVEVPEMKPDERQNLAAALMAVRKAEAEEASAPNTSQTGAADFLTQQEVQGAPTQQPAPEPKRVVTLEERLGANWLLRIGGVLVIIGAAFFAALIQTELTPPLRVFSGYAFAAILGGAGWWLTKKNKLAGRTLQVIALALGYFVSFASGFFAQTKVFENFAIPSILMIGFGAAIVIAAERWRSQFLAIFGFMLAMISILIGAHLGTSEFYSLAAIAIISVSAAVLLLRNQWVQLTMVTLLGVYGATPLLWGITGLEDHPGALAANLLALFSYHLIFTAAFWRWGRVWIARERMYERELAEGTIPSGMTLPSLPYSRAFAVVNSLALVGLSTLALWVTKIYWPLAHYLFFALAALELARMTVPTFRRTGLVAFHAALASGLITAGVMSALHGLGESMVLALQAVIVMIAGTRSPQLRWLAPFAVFPALLSMTEFDYTGLTTAADYFGALLTPILLFVAVMPWRRYWTMEAPLSSGRLAYAVATTSKFVMCVCATFLLTVVAGEYAVPGKTQGEFFALSWVFLVFANLFLYAALFLRIRAWQLPAAFYTLASIGCVFGGADSMPLAAVAALGLQVLLYSFGWDILTKRSSNPLKIAYSIFWFVVTVTAVIVCAAIVDRGMWGRTYNTEAEAMLFEGRRAFIFMGIAIAALATRVYRRSKLNVFDAVAGEAETLPSTPYLSLSLFFTVAFALVATLISFQDAQTNPLSAVVISAIALTFWFFEGRRAQSSRSVMPLAILGLIVGSAGLLIYTRFAETTITGLVVFGMAFMVLSMKLRRISSSMIAAVYAVVLTVVALVAIYQPANNAQIEVAAGLTTAILMLLSTPLLARARKFASLSNEHRAAADLLEAFGNGIAIILALALLASGVLVGAKFITVAWGVLAFALLVGGFVFYNRTMRYGAMAIFALSIGRVMLYDLANSDRITKVIAFIGLGILLIIAGAAYGVLSKKFLREPKPAQEDVKPEIPAE